MVLWNRNRRLLSYCQNAVGVKLVPWLSCLKHNVQVRASSHVAEMGIWRDSSNSSVFGLLAGSPHSEFSPANTAWPIQILRCALYCFFSLSAQLGKWAAIQIQFAAVSQEMLTQTNQLKPVLLGNNLPLTMHHCHLHASTLLIFLLIFLTSTLLRNFHYKLAQNPVLSRSPNGLI